VVAIALVDYLDCSFDSRREHCRRRASAMESTLLTGGLNVYLQHATDATNALLIVSSAVIDAIGLFLHGKLDFRRLGERPFLALLLFARAERR
jgi:hypothetical protein